MLIFILLLTIQLKISQLKHPALIVFIIIVIKWQYNSRCFYFDLVINPIISAINNIHLHISHFTLLFLQCLFIPILHFKFKSIRCLNIHHLSKSFYKDRVIFDTRTIYHSIQYPHQLILYHFLLIFQINKLLHHSSISDHTCYNLCFTSLKRSQHIQLDVLQLETHHFVPTIHHLNLQLYILTSKQYSTLILSIYTIHF